MRLVLRAFEKMHVVRRDKAEAEFPGKPRKHGVAFPLRLQPVVVHLDVEIFRAKNVAELAGDGFRLRDLIGLDVLVDLAL